MGSLCLTVVLLSVLCLQGLHCLPDQATLHIALRRDLDPTIIPLSEQNSTVEVRLKISLVKILDVDEENDEVEILAWEQYSWNDFNLRWNPLDYGGLTNIRLPHDAVWMPDVTLYNAVKAPEVTTPKLVVVFANGDVLYVPSVRRRFFCDLSEVDSDTGAECAMKYGSWTYDGNLLNFTQPSPDYDFDLNEYRASGEYTVQGTTVEKETKYYVCCPEPYVDLKFKFTLKKNGNGFFSSIF